MSKQSDYRLEQLRKEEAELVKAAGEGEMVSSDPTEGTDPTQSTTENLLEPSEGESKVTAEEDTKKEPTEQGLDYWKQRALEAESRFGKYKSKTDLTIYTLRTETKELRERIINMTERQAAQTIAKPTIDINEVFNQGVVDVLGEEAVEAIKKVVAQTNERVDLTEAKLLEQDKKQMTSKLQQDSVSAYETFVEALENLVPDCRTLNQDAGFLSYLDGFDSTGTPRLVRLQAAQKIGDVERVASFFDAYKNSLETHKTPRKDSIASRTGPVQKSSSTDVKKDTGVEPITLSFMNKHESDVAKGKFRGRESERKAIDKRIEEAYLAGKIINE